MAQRSGASLAVQPAVANPSLNAGRAVYGYSVRAAASPRTVVSTCITPVRQAMQLWPSPAAAKTSGYQVQVPQSRLNEARMVTPQCQRVTTRVCTTPTVSRSPWSYLPAMATVASAFHSPAPSPRYSSMMPPLSTEHRAWQWQPSQVQHSQLLAQVPQLQRPGQSSTPQRGYHYVPGSTQLQVLSEPKSVRRSISAGLLATRGRQPDRPFTVIAPPSGPRAPAEAGESVFRMLSVPAQAQSPHFSPPTRQEQSRRSPQPSPQSTLVLAHWKVRAPEESPSPMQEFRRVAPMVDCAVQTPVMHSRKVMGELKLSPDAPGSMKESPVPEWELQGGWLSPDSAACSTVSKVESYHRTSLGSPSDPSWRISPLTPPGATKTSLFPTSPQPSPTPLSFSSSSPSDTPLRSDIDFGMSPLTDLTPEATPAHQSTPEKPSVVAQDTAPAEQNGTERPLVSATPSLSPPHPGPRSCKDLMEGSSSTSQARNRRALVLRPLPPKPKIPVPDDSPELLPRSLLAALKKVRDRPSPVKPTAKVKSQPLQSSLKAPLTKEPKQIFLPITEVEETTLYETESTEDVRVETMKSITLASKLGEASVPPFTWMKGRPALRARGLAWHTRQRLY